MSRGPTSKSRGKTSRNVEWEAVGANPEAEHGVPLGVQDVSDEIPEVEVGMVHTENI